MARQSETETPSGTAAPDRPRMAETEAGAPGARPGAGEPPAAAALSDQAALPPPRPIESRLGKPGAPADTLPSRPDLSARFRLPPPAPSTDMLADARGAGVLPPPSSAPQAGPPMTPRRRLALDAAARPPAEAPVPAQLHTERFLYAPGAAGLAGAEQQRLHSLASMATKADGVGVEIRAFSGPADGDAVEARRVALSRAMEVRGMLIEAGVPGARILARAIGLDGEPLDRVDVFLVKRR